MLEIVNTFEYRGDAFKIKDDGWYYRDPTGYWSSGVNEPVESAILCRDLEEAYQRYLEIGLIEED